MKEPKKINPLIVIDFETGGLSNLVNPVTEVGMMLINGATLESVVAYDNLVRPYDDKLIYDPIAAKVTGITKEMCQRDGVRLAQVVDDMILVIEEAQTLSRKTAKPIFVAHNWPFDRGFLMNIFHRAGKDLSKLVDGGIDHTGTFVPTALDTLDLAKQCWADICDKTTKFKLGVCCQRAGIDYTDGHRAMSDVVPTGDLIKYFMTRLRSGSNDVTISQGAISVHRQTFEW
jgi:DNA polymerase III epsilon subunit-like protein